MATSRSYIPPTPEEMQRNKEAKDKVLSAAEVGLVNKRAQMNATVTGLTSGILTGFLSRRFFGFTPNAAVFTAIGVGAFIGYIESRTEVARGMAALAYAHEQRTGVPLAGNESRGGLSAAQQPVPGAEWDLKAGNEARFDAGVGGMHEYVDRGATTRGDH